MCEAYYNLGNPRYRQSVRISPSNGPHHRPVITGIRALGLHLGLSLHHTGLPAAGRPADETLISLCPVAMPAPPPT